MTNPTFDTRRQLDGGVDFTMMYTAHDAFSRHLTSLIDAVSDGRAATSGTTTRWTLFERQLHIHHTAEDIALWPPLRDAVTTPNELALLAAMEAEHAQIDPLLERIADGFAAAKSRIDNDGVLLVALRELIDGLSAHMRHEESGALPLVERYLGPAGWAKFGKHIRETQGLRAGAIYFPWLLDGADSASSKKVLGIVPPPVRMIYRFVWAPRYRRSLT